MHFFKRKKIVLSIIFISFLTLVITYSFLIKNTSQTLQNTDLNLEFTIPKNASLDVEKVQEFEELMKSYSVEIKDKDIKITISRNLYDFNESNMQNITGGGIIRPPAELTDKYIYIGEIDNLKIYGDKQERNMTLYSQISENTLSFEMPIWKQNSDLDSTVISIVISDEIQEKDIDKYFEKALKIIKETKKI